MAGAQTVGLDPPGSLQVLTQPLVLAGPSVRRHPAYYFADGNVIFLVEDCLFNVHRTFLQTCADSAFGTMFTIPPSVDGKSEGSNDDDPISLAQVSVQEFESLLRILYRPVLEDARNIPIPTYNRALKLAKIYAMRDVSQAILAVVLKDDGTTANPIDLTKSFERFHFAVDHQEMVPGSFAIKYYTEICRAAETPTLSHLEMLRSHLDRILQIMNGRVWVRTNIYNSSKINDWCDPGGHNEWRKLVKGWFW